MPAAAPQGDCSVPLRLCAGKRGAEIVRELTGKQVMVAVDPTLLVSMAHWQTLAKPIDSEQKYLFCYFLSENARYLETAEKSHGKSI